jgi:hypothetical protein
MAGFTSKVVGSELILTVDISKEAIAGATVSKSGAAKALKDGLPVPAPSLVATSCGFQTVGNVRFSLNVSKAG